MKVLHIISGGDRGGAKTHMFAMLKRLCVYAEVTVVCLMAGEFYEEIIKKPIRTLLFEQKRRADLSVCNKVRELITAEHFDIVNAHGARANFIMSLICEKINIPTVTTVHSDPRLDFDDPYKKFVYTALNEKALRKIKYKIAVSDSFRDMLISRGCQPNDIGVVYNGLEFGASEPGCTKEQFAQKHKIPYICTDVYFGMAARLDRVKGVDVFLRAAAAVLESVPNARFVIIGGGAERDSLYALMRELNIEKRTHFLGHVSEIYDFYNFIDVNCMSSRSESFPYAMLEGANASKATVASAVGGIPKLIIDGETGLLFNAGDSMAMAEKMISLAKDRNNGGKLIENYGKSLNTYAKEHYSSDALAKSYLANYERFILYYNSEKTNDVLLAGYYGFGNLGDELLASALTSSVKAADPMLRLTVMTAAPKTGAGILGVNCVNRFNPAAVYRAMKNSRLFVLGGGSLIQDVTSRKSLTYYLTLVEWAKKAGCKTALIAGGVGPLLRQNSIRAAVKTLGKLDSATLRDNSSCAFFDEHCANVKHKTTADASFLLDGKKTEKREGYLLVSLRPWKNAPPNFAESIAVACARYAAVHCVEVLFVPMQPVTDMAISQKTADLAVLYGAKARLIKSENASLEQILGIISGAGAVLGMRLHSLICAAAAGVPIAGISYDVKVDAFFNECCLPPPLQIACADADSIYDALENAAVPKDRDKFRAAATENTDEILRLLK